MSGRIFVFGDIHGEYDKFMKAWEGAKINPYADEMIFLGDYIDRGPAPRKVLDFLMDLPKRNVHLLMGNHEKMFLDAAGKVEKWTDDTNLGGEFFYWFVNGGAVTFKQISESWAEFQKYIDFLRCLPLCYEQTIEGQEYFFCHGGVNPDRKLGEQEEQDLLWIREPYIWGYKGEVTVVTGHTPVCYIDEDRYTPIVRENQIFMDTGSYMPKGKVSCMELISGEIWQG